MRIVLAFVLAAVTGALLVALFSYSHDPQAVQSPVDRHLESDVAGAANVTTLTALSGIQDLGTADFLTGAAALDDVEVLVALIEREVGSARSHSHPSRLEILIRRLAEVDPQRALRLVGEMPSGVRYAAIVLSAWAAEDDEGALQALNLFSDDAAVRHRLAVSVLEVVGFSDAAVNRVTGAVPGIDRIGLVTGALAALAESDPAGAFDRAMSIPDFSMRRAAVPQIAEVWARSDPAMALSHVKALPTPALAIASRTRIMGYWASTDPDGFLAYLQQADVIEFQSAGQALASVAALDPGRVSALVSVVPAAVEGLVSNAVAIAAAHTHPMDVLGAAGDPSGSPGFMAVRSAAAALSASDPAAALEWVRANPGVGQGASAAIAREIGAHDLARALQFAETLPASARAAWIGDAMMHHVDHDPWTAISVITAMRDQAGYDDALEVAVQRFAIGNPYYAVYLLDGAGRSANLRAVPALAQTWARRQPADAVQWAVGLADSELRDVALGMIVDTVASTSPAGLDANARSLVVQYISDPVLRQQATAMIERLAEREAASMSGASATGPR